ncbi:putative sphingosine kinase A, B [Trypanosoma vivax]|nr:putative sphingosine kinase A, B [Trypanosoma vivax]
MSDFKSETTPPGISTTLVPNMDEPLDMRLGKNTEGDEKISVMVNYRRFQATLTFMTGLQRLVLTREKHNGKEQCIMNISTWNIVNIETSEEMLLRQAKRHINDGAHKRSASSSNEGHFTSLQRVFQRQACQSRTFDEVTICPHSASPSMGSASVGVHSRTTSGVRATGITYYLHYIKDKRSKSAPYLSTLQFTTLQSASNQQEVMCLVQRLLHNVYPCGVKKLLFFISRKSGNGSAWNIYRDMVQPVLHFSRHEIEAIVTTRARHCEDYIADLVNDISGHHVIVTIGGDGMMYETVNGLSRRRKVLSATDPTVTRKEKNGLKCDAGCPLKVERGEDAHSDPGTARPSSSGTVDRGRQIREGRTAFGGRGMTDSMFDLVTLAFPLAGEAQNQAPELPLIATIPAGSGCGMAKTLNVCSIKESILALVHLRCSWKDTISVQYKQSDCTETMDSNRTDKGNRTDSLHNSTDSYSGGVAERGSVLEGGAVDDVTIERVACMTSTFGVFNEIDCGSEKLRWMGNARFTAFAGFILLRGLRSYGARLRYLPWSGKSGQQLLKLCENDKLPTEEELPACTSTDECPHCSQFMPNRRRMLGTCVQRDGRGVGRATNIALPQLHGVSTSDIGALEGEVGEVQEQENEEMEAVRDIDFDNEDLPWVTLEGKFAVVFISNTRHATKDVLMTPFAHMGDGSLDIVFIFEKKKSSRRDFVRFFLGLETGKHVHLPFVSYVKARAVELEGFDGNIMIDGEMLPSRKVRILPRRCDYQFVHGCGSRTNKKSKKR